MAVPFPALLALLGLATPVTPWTSGAPSTPTALGSSAPQPALSIVRQDDDEEEEFPDKRPEIKEMISNLADHAKKRGKEDREAIAIIDQLLQEFPESGPKDRKSIVTGLDKCFKEKRQETEDGVPDNQLYMASALALGRMGPESVKPLIGWIGHKSHRKDLVLQRQLILSLGRTKDEDAVKPLTKLMKDDKPLIQAAAAEALGEFDGAELKVRKEIFEELLKTMMAVRSIVDQNPAEIIERERWNTISPSINTSLQRLSGIIEQDAHKWQSWWNNNKKRDWDDN